MSKPYPPAKIRVFRDHPDWDKREKWWMMPMQLLNELHIATYEMAHDELPLEEDIAYVERQHPGCVYVY